MWTGGPSQPWGHSVLIFQSPLCIPIPALSLLPHRALVPVTELFSPSRSPIQSHFPPLSSFTEPLSPSSSHPLSLIPYLLSELLRSRARRDSIHWESQWPAPLGEGRDLW